MRRREQALLLCIVDQVGRLMGIEPTTTRTTTEGSTTELQPPQGKASLIHDLPNTVKLLSAYPSKLWTTALQHVIP